MEKQNRANALYKDMFQRASEISPHYMAHGMQLIKPIRKELTDEDVSRTLDEEVSAGNLEERKRGGTSTFSKPKFTDEEVSRMIDEEIRAGRLIENRNKGGASTFSRPLTDEDINRMLEEQALTSKVNLNDKGTNVTWGPIPPGGVVGTRPPGLVQALAPSASPDEVSVPKFTRPGVPQTLPPASFTTVEPREPYVDPHAMTGYTSQEIPPYGAYPPAYPPPPKPLAPLSPYTPTTATTLPAAMTWSVY